VNRSFFLAVLLAMLLAACASDQADQPTATLTPEPPTPAPTDTPAETDEPAATDDGGGTSSLDELIPDELNGVAGTPIPGLDQILSGMLQGQGIDAGDAEFAFVTYGTGEDAVVLQAFRIPGVSEGVIQQLAQAMSAGGGAGGEFETETTTIGGKTVLSFTGSGTPGVVYFYVADDVAFTVGGQDAASVEQLISELP
jgi:hypothetical protein